MADGNKKVTSGDVRAALKLRYPAQSHALLFEVAPTTGGGTRYADAVAFGLWASHGHAIEGIEIKVSRADFLHELKQPEKSEPVMRFCNRWWLACPASMVTPEELPPTWGLLELMENGTLRQKVKAPKLEPVAPTLGFMGAMIRRSAGMDEEMSNAAFSKRIIEATDRIREELRREFERKASVQVEQAEAGLALIQRLKDETGIDLNDWTTKKELVAAVKLAMNFAGWNGIESLRRSAVSLIADIDGCGLIPAEKGAAG